MCLDRVDRTILKDSEEFKVKGFGWKVFRKERTVRGKPALNAILRDLPRNISRSDIGRWLEERKFRSITVGEFLQQSYISYRVGWHFYLTRKEALANAATTVSEVVRKIRYKGLVARGTQNGYRVLVAKKIMLVKI